SLATLVVGSILVVASQLLPALATAAAPARGPTSSARERMAAKAPKTIEAMQEMQMSAGGARAAGLLRDLTLEEGASRTQATLSRYGFTPLVIGSSDVIVHGAGDVNTQSET